MEPEPTSSSATRRLNAYFARFVTRSRRLQTLKALAAGLTGVFVIGLGVVLYTSRTGFPEAVMHWGRFGMLASAILAAVWVGWLPLRRLKRQAIDHIEEQTPALAGRAETFAEIRANDDHPFADLLAEDAWAIAERFPPEKQIPLRSFRIPGVISAVVCALLVGLTAVGPGNLGPGFRHLFAGWLVDGLLPDQQLKVVPGDEAIRRGGSVRFNARAAGFEPGSATLHVRLGSEDWQAIPMTPLADRSFDFSLYSLQDDASYYIQAEAVRSPTYEIDVVDLPAIENLKVTYFYPDWTGREPRSVEPAGDIRALAGTDVEVTIETSQPLPSPALVLNGEIVALERQGNEASARFRIDEEGQYFVGSALGSEPVRLSDDYFISLIDDRAPKVSFTKPGRDWKASNIEEVTTRLQAADDFRVERLTIHYSVNGADWQQVDLDPATSDDSGHTFYLESIAGDGGASLQPGDLVTYYAEANDRQQATQTDMFFIEIQPFDRRYTQSQQAGGGAGGGSLSDEISARQREIIVSTWNLIREQASPRGPADSYIDDNAKLLSDLQTTLRTQAETLAERARARQLSVDDDIARFVGHLEDAADAMVPASEQLAEIAFRAALQPEQEALQHLLRAEAVFRDINVTMQQQGANGSGGQAGRDLAEMFEMEMDLEKNQYETGSQAQTDTPDQALDEIAEKLKALAERQQRLAEKLARQNKPTPEERWKQEMLRRETEALKRQLEQLRRSSQQSAEAGSSGSTPDGGASGSASESTQTDSDATDNDERARQQAELERRVDSALRAMRDSSEAMDGAAAEDAARAAAEAERQLDGASSEAQAASDRALQASLDDMRARATDLLERQRAIEREIQTGVAEELSGERAAALSFEAERDIADRKRALQESLEKLEQDMRGAAHSLEASDTEITEALRDGIESISEQRIKERLALSALYVEQGEARYIASSESMITESLRELRNALTEARQRNGEQVGPSDAPSLSDALREAQSLRAALQAGDPQREAQGQAESQNGVPGDPSQANQNSEENSASSTLTGDRGGVAEQREQTLQALRAALNGREGDALDSELRNQLGALRRAMLATDPQRNERLLGTETETLQGLTEQLELLLRAALRADTAVVRGTNPEIVPERYRKEVAEYYRRLANDQALGVTPTTP